MKRAFDILAAGFGLIALSPLLLILALLVARKLGRPILFRQLRPGMGGVAFKLVKFCTMTDSRDADGRLLPDEERLLPFGSWLRRTSLDELPELWNVLIGDMSFVGPRPLLMEYLPLYSTEQSRRHEVRPGITGWAQASGRNSLKWEEKFKLDVWYVDHRSFWLDLKILALTPRKVLASEGISAPGEVSMPVFTGSHSMLDS